MTIFVAGGSGTIGIPLVRALVAGGHQVTALTRSASKRDRLRALGAGVAVADALDREALIAALAAARPTHVIHQLTALPPGGPRRSSDLDATNRLRIDGTRHLLEAAIHVHARRFIVGSFAMLSPRGPASDAGHDAGSDAAAEAVRSMERQVLEATERRAIEGVILRYGMFYGLDAPSTVTMIEMVRKRRLPVVRGDAGQLPLIHVEDAVSATVRALDHGPAGATYDIVDDRAASLTEIVEAIAEFTGSAAPIRVPACLPRLVAPYMARMTSMRMPLSNAQAKAELDWRLRYSTLRDGLAQLVRDAA
jgi:nucleoside-diphosphate-sugar epimerase